MSVPPASLNQTGPAQAQPDLQRLAVIETRVSDFEKRLDDQGDSYARAEIILAAFGIILTILVIYLGWRVERSAIQAATGVAKEDLKRSKEEVEGCVKESKEVLVEAKSILLDIRGHKALAAESVEEIRVMRTNVTPSSEKKR